MKIIKLAIIRSDEDVNCPFGLPIGDGCRTVGDTVDNMQPIENNDELSDKDKEIIIRQNLRAWQNTKESKRCKYAIHLFKHHPNFVDCDFNDTAAGLSKNVSFNGSPYYSQMFEGMSPAGLNAVPLYNNSDGAMFRNLYYGIYGFASKRVISSILRQALLNTLKISKS